MSDIRTSGGVPGSAPAAGPPPQPPAAQRPGVREWLLRFLTLREGSIIVVTVLADRCTSR